MEMTEKFQELLMKGNPEMNMKDLARELHDFMKEELSGNYPHLAEKLHERIDAVLLGPHFNEKRLKQALSELKWEDGSPAANCTLEQTNDVAQQGKLVLDSEFNQYDFCYAMNYERMRHKGFVTMHLGSDNVKYYFDLAKCWKPKRTVPEGAIYVHYKTMQELQHCERD